MQHELLEVDLLLDPDTFEKKLCPCT